MQSKVRAAGPKDEDWEDQLRFLGSAKGRVGKRKAISAQVGFALSRMQVFRGRRVEACGQSASRRARKRGEKEKCATTRGAHARAPHFGVWTCEGRRGQNVVR